MPADFALFLNWAMVLCGVMAVVWAFRWRSRGIKAMPMFLAFIVCGVGLFLIRGRAGTWTLIAFGAVLLILLFLDAIGRVLLKEEAK